MGPDEFASPRLFRPIPELLEPSELLVREFEIALCSDHGRIPRTKPIVTRREKDSNRCNTLIGTQIGAELMVAEGHPLTKRFHMELTEPRARAEPKLRLRRREAESAEAPFRFGSVNSCYVVQHFEQQLPQFRSVGDGESVDLAQDRKAAFFYSSATGDVAMSSRMVLRRRWKPSASAATGA